MIRISLLQVLFMRLVVGLLLVMVCWLMLDLKFLLGLV